MKQKIIALCGNPLSGKTTAAALISQSLGYEVGDDGRALRDIAVNNFGLTEAQVSTQEGKREFVELNGKRWMVREILGQIGNSFERTFGPDIIPLMALNTHNKNLRTLATFKDREPNIVWGSVRREQGKFWRSKGALVLEITNPLAPVSQFEFDRYSPEYCHAVINNDGLSRDLSKQDAIKDLREKLVSAIERLYP